MGLCASECECRKRLQGDVSRRERKAGRKDSWVGVRKKKIGGISTHGHGDTRACQGKPLGELNSAGQKKKARGHEGGANARKLVFRTRRVGRPRKNSFGGGFVW